MKISDLIKSSLDSSDRKELNQAMLFACLAVDGTAKKLYPGIKKNGERYRKFIVDHIDIIELMYGGVNLKETVFPFGKNNRKDGMKFEDVVYEKFRCHLAHGDELSKGYSINVKVGENVQHSTVNVEEQSLTLPESVIFALGLPCVLSPVNENQSIGSYVYHYRDPINYYVVDRWWGKIDCARKIMDFGSQIKVKLEF
ncbi:hypothetical protein [Microbulbifer variabilis]|uniref:hypothetical protein n=1 Tax=Microbulbifer variabilis TaxID=266805 RepID=UPI001CFEB2B0|nr:hypothetical protein [Microbulbifer variabilis]